MWKEIHDTGESVQVKTLHYLREDKSRSGLTRLKNATREKGITVTLFGEYEATLIKDFTWKG